LQLTLLSPDHDRLFGLKDRWDEEPKRARVDRGAPDYLRRKLEASRELPPLGDVLGGWSSSPSKLDAERNT
jgi:hypothetical protein